jgi:hypothetical protein
MEEKKLVLSLPPAVYDALKLQADGLGLNVRSYIELLCAAASASEGDSGAAAGLAQPAPEAGQVTFKLRRRAQ